MLTNILLLVIGFILLTYGADFFVEGASALARKLKIPAIIIGLTIVAMGTSAPEAAVSINSALKGVNGIAIGNILGSNIANIFLILGATALIYPLTMPKNTIKFEMPFVTFITILISIVGYYTGFIDRTCALFLLLLFALFLFYLFKISKEEEHEEKKNLSVLKIIIFIVGGLLALIYGSELTVKGATHIAQILHISERVIGLTVIAIGTSLPELIVCIVAAFKHENDLAVGNIIGSNIFNILFVLGLSGTIIPMSFNRNFLFDGIIALLAIALLFLYSFKSKKLSRIQGFSFLVIYLVYIAFLIFK